MEARRSDPVSRLRFRRVIASLRPEAVAPVTALSDALTAAQRSALAAREKAYVAGAVESEAMVAALESAGISDPVDTAFLLSALDVLKEWGVSATTEGGMMSERHYLTSDEYQRSQPQRITRREIEAVRYATEELRSYYETVGEEACLDDEEMPTGLIPDVLGRLDRFLARVDDTETVNG